MSPLVVAQRDTRVGSEDDSDDESRLLSEVEPSTENEKHASTELKENLLNEEQRILNGKKIFYLNYCFLLCIFCLAGRFRLFKETQYAHATAASRRYFDEVEPLGPTVVLRNFECQAAMTLIDDCATQQARKVS